MTRGTLALALALALAPLAARAAVSIDGAPGCFCAATKSASTTNASSTTQVGCGANGAGAQPVAMPPAFAATPLWCLVDLSRPSAGAGAACGTFVPGVGLIGLCSLARVGGLSLAAPSSAVFTNVPPSPPGTVQVYTGQRVTATWTPPSGIELRDAVQVECVTPLSAPAPSLPSTPGGVSWANSSTSFLVPDNYTFTSGPTRIPVSWVGTLPCYLQAGSQSLLNSSAAPQKLTVLSVP
jgi:hypothetical protein